MRIIFERGQLIFELGQLTACNLPQLADNTLRVV